MNPARLYRCTKSYPPELSDFYSFNRLGIEPAMTPDDPTLLDGVTVFDSVERLERLARRSNWKMGKFIVEVAPGPALNVRKTGGAGHYTIDNEPEDILACVTRLVMRVD